MTQYILRDIKKGRLVIAALWIVYAASYFIRSCYAASIGAIVSEGIYTKGEVGLIGTAFFICYGVGQLISGLLGDKVNPFYMVIFGSFAGSISCFLMIFADKLIIMLAVWAANGFFQSMLWSPILRIFSQTIHKSLREKAILNISLSLPAGTICAYFLSTLIIKYLSWKHVFLCGGICISAAGAFVLFTVLYIKNDINKTTVQNAVPAEKPEKSKGKFFPSAVLSGLIIIMVPSFLHGMMRDGITNWVPTMISETYDVSVSFSVFLTILLPVFNAFGAYAVVPLYKKLGENEMKTVCVTAAAALVPFILLLFIGRLPVYLIIILLALGTSIMYAMNYLIISLVPVRFSAHSMTSTVSGVLNSAAHLGCALSSYGFGAAAEKAGWNSVIIIWIVSAVLILAFSFLSDIKWKEFIK